MAARKAAQVTYLSAYQSFLSRTVQVIYNYVKTVIMESVENILYIGTTAIPTLCLFFLKKVFSLCVRPSYRSSTTHSDFSSHNPSSSLTHSLPRSLRLLSSEEISFSHPHLYPPPLPPPLTTSSSSPPRLSPSPSSSPFAFKPPLSSPIAPPPLSSILPSPPLFFFYPNPNHETLPIEGINPNRDMKKKKLIEIGDDNNNYNENESNNNYPPSDMMSITVEEKRVLKLLRSKSKELLGLYSQPMKSSLAVVITSLFILIDQLQNSYQNGLWAVLVVILIRQENTSSSFLTGYQRLEGTVVGAVYAYTMFQIFNCSKERCGMNVSTPVLVIWLAFCAFFRDGPRHGYAALVAGFTPIVLFLGPYASNSDTAWQRIQETWLGVGIYLLIDNLILPNRIDVALRSGVLQRIEETRSVLTVRHYFNIHAILTNFEAVSY